jgi:hypothetical protein
MPGMPAVRTWGPRTVVAVDEAHGPHFDRPADAPPEAVSHLGEPFVRTRA